MSKKLLTTLLAGALTASMVIPAFASGGGVVPVERGTEIKAGIIIDDPDAKFKVEVPTLFAFVVIGTVNSSETGGVTSEGGDILLPNVTVKVKEKSGELPAAAGESKYAIEATSDTSMRFTNYSTIKNTSTANDAPDRLGLAVEVNGVVKNEGTAIERNNWEHVSRIASTKADPLEDEFKKYNISIDGTSFDVEADGGYTMKKGFELDAPFLGYDSDTDTYSNLDDTTNLAVNGASKDVEFNVAVGGSKNQYKQVEESAKVGTIVWTVSTDIDGDGVYTAPGNEYLDGVKETDAAGVAIAEDPDNIN